jgi:hypothetical protein
MLLQYFRHADAAKLESTLEGVKKGHVIAMEGLQTQLQKSSAENTRLEEKLKDQECGDPAYHCMCSMQVIDITPMKHSLTSITSIRVVQQKHRRSKVCL